MNTCVRFSRHGLNYVIGALVFTICILSTIYVLETMKPCARHHAYIQTQIPHHVLIRLIDQGCKLHYGELFCPTRRVLPRLYHV